MEISLREFSINQPSYPNVTETDPFYVKVANDIANNILNCSLCKSMPEALIKKIALTLTDYLQDIVSDAGIWRSFIIANRNLYGFTLPFYEINDSYIDFELNKEDIRFLVWYVVSMLWDEMRLIHPHDEHLLCIADKCYEIMASKYDDCPVPEAFNIAKGLNFNDPEDRPQIYNLTSWLFLHCYLMTPAFAVSLREMASDLNPDDNDFGLKLNQRLENAMLNDTTGPLALFAPEWTYLIIEGKLPSSKENNKGEPHKFYEAFVKYTGGKDIMFFNSYEDMNNFFINALGWNKNEEHLSQVKGQHDYILMVDETKGMLLAVNIARCVKAPDNQIYDPYYAQKYAFSLLIDRGKCPGDLLLRLLKNNWLPDAHYPGTDDYEFVKKYSDSIARTFLQLYYRGD